LKAIPAHLLSLLILATPFSWNTHSLCLAIYSISSASGLETALTTVFSDHDFL